MSRFNLRLKALWPRTHEGAPAARNLTIEQQLRRSVLSCLLWEREFYEDGQSIADRIVALAEQASPPVVAALAIEARNAFNLRHAPLLLLAALAKTGAGTRLVSETIAATVQRADELSEFLAIYWRNGKTPLSAQVKKGLALAFKKFDAYQLAKYDRGNVIRLRDVLFLSHAKPANDDQQLLWKQLVDNELSAPDTWEVGLSGGADKKGTFERLICERKIGYLALLRNLRNMVNAGCDLGLMQEAILARKGAERVLPFRYVAAARACPMLEPAIDDALRASIAEMAPFSGLTVVLVDVSASMDARLSARSDLTRKDAAAALAAILPGKVRMFSFADQVIELPPRRGMAAIDAIRHSQNGGTRLFDAIETVNREVAYDRLIVITDEQAFPANADLLRGNEQNARRTCPAPNGTGYMINVASYRNGVGYGPWCHIDGFSEQVLRFIAEQEALRG
ncbi:MAG TPA: TROVE domain-containing protein [Stellaceae bacterium]|jgi:60 kDa SS-A/Ro ribonucleoprotein|nr:TROVE domain-containing protein [Stellaceae bacterium]